MSYYILKFKYVPVSVSLVVNVKENMFNYVFLDCVYSPLVFKLDF